MPRGLQRARGVKSLFDGEISARPADKLPRRATFDEFEAVAECPALAHERVYFNPARRQGELQANHFVQGDFLREHGGNSRFADIYTVSPNHLLVTRVYANLDFQIETGRPTGINKWIGWPSLEWMRNCQ